MDTLIIIIVKILLNYINLYMEKCQDSEKIWKKSQKIGVPAQLMKELPVYTK